MLFLLFADWKMGLRKDLQRTQQKAFAKGTIKNYKCQLKKFFQFSNMAELPDLPISTEDLCLYIQFLSRSLKSHQSILCYVSGLKFFHTLLGLSFPSTSSVEVRLTLKGLKRSLAHVPVQAKPITPEILRRMGDCLDLHRPLHCVFWCLFLFLFFLFSRKSQFIPENVSQAQLGRLVTRQDVSIRDGKLLVMFRWTKTRQFGCAPLVIPLSPIRNSSLCPIQAYINMCNLVQVGPQSPLFVLPGSECPILYTEFHKVLRWLLTKAGMDSAGFSSHSFRRGGATFAFGLGIRGELIQAQGDWLSDAYKLYLNMDMSHRLSVSETMASHLSTP